MALPLTGRRLPLSRSLCLTLCGLQGCGFLAGELADDTPLAFPTHPVRATADARAYDVDGDGRVDFEVRRSMTGRLDHLLYDDDQDGTFDREYSHDVVDRGRLPHLILLVDSVPHRIAKRRHDAGWGGWFYPPSLVIPPFPSMSVVIFSEMLGAPPMGATVERYLAPAEGEVHNTMIERVFGLSYPWHRRLSWYLKEYLYVGATYVAPEEWLRHEITRVKAAFDASPHRVVLCYVSASSGLISVKGEEGADEVLDALEQLTLELLYERRGEVEISIVSDHGHNLMPSTRLDIEGWLEEGGFHCVDVPEAPDDVFLEVDGLVTYFGVQTEQPTAIADTLLKHEELSFAVWVEGDHLRVRNHLGDAVVERRGDRFRYRADGCDVLEMASVLDALQQSGELDHDGFASDRAWFDATVAGEYPDAVRRLWDAFHGQVRNPCRVMFAVNDGYYAGMAVFDPLIEMGSTHGGLNRINSDAVLLTTRPIAAPPLRSRNVLRAIEPRFDPDRIVERYED